MEFDDEERQEEQNDDVEEQQQIDTPPQPQPPNSLSPAGGRKPVAAVAVRYKECQKNHAIRIGGHAIDGCGEFMATGPEGTLEALKCAACNCHRNFHRKETAGVLAMYPPAPPPVYLHQPHPHVAPHVQQPVPLAAARPSSSAEEPSSGGEGSGRGRKRFRTKFTAEQKEKMLAFAERAGWRIQKHDEAEVQRFCQEVKVNRQVLKVWMHNNKNNNSARNP